MELRDIFVKRVKDIRAERGITQADLARRMNVSRSHVCQVERGDCDPTTATVEKFATALGVPPHTLLR